MNQFLLPPLKQFAPLELAFLGCNCHNINSTGIFQLQALPHSCMGPHKESRHEKCSQGRDRRRKLQLEEPTSLTLQILCVSGARPPGVSGARPLHQGCNLPERTSLVVTVAPGGGISCEQRKFLCCRWVYFSFLLSWFNRKQQEEERPADLALQVDLKRVHFSRETKNKKMGGGKAKIILN